VARSFWQRLREKLDFANYVPSRNEEFEEAHFDSKAVGRYTVIKNKNSKKYLKLTERDYFIWNLIDARRSVREIIFEYYKEFKSFAFNRVFTLLQELRENGFLRDRPAKVFSWLARIVRERRWIAKFGRFASAFLSKEFSIRRIDRYITVLYKRFFRIFFTRPAAAFFALVSVIGAALFIRLLLLEKYSIMETAGSYSLGVAVLLFINIFVILIHESAHAFAVKSYGREVTRAGFMIYYGMPAFFVDTSDIWLEGKRRRLAVSWAGPFSELILGGLVSIFVTFSPFHAANSILFKACFILFIGAFVNLNPLLNLDGYYMLMDWLEMPLLRKMSFAFVKKGLWKKLARKEKLTRQEKIYTIFGILAGAYSLFTIVAVLYFWQTRIYGTLATIYKERGLAGRVIVLLLAVSFFVPLAYFVLFSAFRIAKKIGRTLVKKRMLQNDYVAACSVILVSAVIAYLAGLNQYAPAAVFLIGAPAVAAALCWRGFFLLKGSPLRYGAALLFALIICFALSRYIIYFEVENLAGVSAGNLLRFLSMISAVLLLGSLLVGIYKSSVEAIAVLAGSLILSLLLCRYSDRAGIWIVDRAAYPDTILLFTCFLVGAYHLVSRPGILVSVSNILLFASGLFILRLSVASAAAAGALPGSLHTGAVASHYVSVFFVSGLALFAIAIRRQRPFRMIEAADEALGDKEALNRAFQKITQTLLSQVAFLRGVSFLKAARRKIARENRKKNMDIVFFEGGAAVDDVRAVSILRLAEIISENLKMFLNESRFLAGNSLTNREYGNALCRLSWREREVLQEHVLADLALDVDVVAEGEYAFRDVTEIMRSNPIFADASDEELKRIAQRARIEDFPDGARIITQGAVGDAFYVIQSGTVEVTKTDGAGIERHLAYLTSGDYFGEVALLEEVPRTANCIARGNVRLISLSKESFDEVVKVHFELSGKIDRAAAKSALIRKMPLFSDFTPSQLRKILLKLKTEVFRKGALIIRQGEIGDKFYIIESGQVEVLLQSDNGGVRSVAKLGKGEYFGEIALLADVPRTASVAAASECALLVLSKEDFEDLIRREMMASESLERVSSRRLLELKRRSGIIGE